MSVTESSPAFFYLIPWLRGLEGDGEALASPESEAAKAVILGWVKTEIKSLALSSGLSLKFTVFDDLILIEDPATV